MSGVLDTPELELWARLRHDEDEDAREQLFSRHARWARGVALNVHRRLWGHSIERSDCIQNATVGLLEAIDRYDPTRGVEFRAFALRRVRGAVFNGLRVLIGDERAAPSAKRFLERAGHLGEPGQGDAVGELIDTVVELGLGFLLECAHSALVDECDGLQHAQSSQLNARLLTGVRSLSGRHRELIEGHYFHHLPFTTFSLRWGVSRGRVSQLHKEALGRLRTSMQAQRPE